MHLFLLTVYLTVLFFPAVVVLLYGIFLGAKFIYKAAFGNSSFSEVLLDLFEFTISNVSFSVLFVAISGVDFVFGSMSVGRRVQIVSLFFGIYIVSKMVNRHKGMIEDARTRNGTPD